MIGSTRGRRGLAVWLLLCAALLVPIAGCGSDDSDSSSSASTESSSTEAETGSEETSSEESAGSAVVEEAKAQVEKYSAAQPPIKIEPVAKPPQKNVKLALLNCPLPVCRTAIGGAAEAASALGWSTKNYEENLTPEGYVAAWKEALQGNPDGIVYIGLFPPEFVEQQLNEAKSKNIPTAVVSPAGEEASESGPVYGTFHGVPVYELSGELMADSIIADHGEGANTLFIFDKTVEATNGAIKPIFEELIKKSGGTVTPLEVSSEQIGKQIPSQVVSALQRNPDVEYVVFNINDYTAGVAPALEAAGLGDKVKVVSRAAGEAQLKELEDGQLFASIAEEDSSAGYRGIDAIVKVLNGENDNFEANPVEFHQLLNAENADSLGFDKLGFYLTPGSPEAFLEAWGVSEK